jgi:hypothetical protein
MYLLEIDCFASRAAADRDSFVAKTLAACTRLYTMSVDEVATKASFMI